MARRFFNHPIIFFVGLGAVLLCLSSITFRLMPVAEIQFLPDAAQFEVRDIGFCRDASTTPYNMSTIQQADFVENHISICGYIKNTTPGFYAYPHFYILPAGTPPSAYDTPATIKETDGFFVVPVTDADITPGHYTLQMNKARVPIANAAFTVIDPALQRFIQPDTIVPNASNPQTFNRYSYTVNNPVNYADPSGHDIMVVGGGTSMTGMIQHHGSTGLWHIRVGAQMNGVTYFTING